MPEDIVIMQKLESGQIKQADAKAVQEDIPLQSCKAKKLDVGKSKIIVGNYSELYLNGIRQGISAEQLHNAVVLYNSQGLPCIISSTSSKAEYSQYSNYFLKHLISRIVVYTAKLIDSQDALAARGVMVNLIREMHNFHIKQQKSPRPDNAINTTVLISYKKKYIKTHVDRVFCSGFTIGPQGAVKISSETFKPLTFANEFLGDSSVGEYDTINSALSVDRLIARNENSIFSDEILEENDGLAIHTGLFKELQKPAAHDVMASGENRIAWQLKPFATNSEIFAKQLKEINEEIYKEKLGVFTRYADMFKKTMDERDYQTFAAEIPFEGPNPWYLPEEAGGDQVDKDQEKIADGLEDNGGSCLLVASAVIPNNRKQRELQILACGSLSNFDKDYDDLIFRETLKNFTKVVYEDMAKIESQAKITFKQLIRFAECGYEIYNHRQRNDLIRALLFASDESVLELETVTYCITVIRALAASFKTKEYDTMISHGTLQTELDAGLKSKAMCEGLKSNAKLTAIFELFSKLQQRLPTEKAADILPRFKAEYSRAIQDITADFSRVPDFYLSESANGQNRTIKIVPNFPTMLTKYLIDLEIKIAQIYLDHDLQEFPDIFIKYVFDPKKNIRLKEQIKQTIATFKINYEIYLAKNFTLEKQTTKKNQLVTSLYRHIIEFSISKEELISKLEKMLNALNKVIDEHNREYHRGSIWRDKTGDLGKIFDRFMADLLKVMRLIPSFVHQEIRAVAERHPILILVVDKVIVSKEECKTRTVIRRDSSDAVIDGSNHGDELVDVSLDDDTSDSRLSTSTSTSSFGNINSLLVRSALSDSSLCSIQEELQVDHTPVKDNPGHKNNAEFKTNSRKTLIEGQAMPTTLNMSLGMLKF